MRLDHFGIVPAFCAALLGGCADSHRATAVPTTPTYLFFNAPLSAVDPRQPTGPITVEPVGTGVTGLQPVAHATYLPYFDMNLGAPIGVLVDRHTRHLVYARTGDGSLWKVSALRRDAPTPVRLSDESGATTVCSSGHEPDYADPANSRYVYRLPGPNGTCNNGDDVWRMVALSMGAGDAPRDAREPLAARRDRQFGTLTGWLAKDNGDLVVYDAEFGTGSAQIVGSYTTTALKVLEAPNGIVFLNVDGTLRAYDPHGAVPALSAPLYSSASGINGPLSDGAHLYFQDGLTIVQASLTGADPAAAIANESSGWISGVVLTDRRVVYAWSDGSGSVTLRAVDKSGGAPVDLAPIGTANDFISMVGAAGRWVYYNRLQNGLSRWDAVAVPDDGGAPAMHADAAWVGWTESTRALAGARNRSVPMSRLLLRTGAAPPYGLVSYDAARHAQVVQLGSLPADATNNYDPFFRRLPNRGDILGRAYFDDTGTQDILYLNTERAGSLTRVTASATNEQPVGATGCTLRRGTDPDAMLSLLLVIAAAHLWRRSPRRRAKTD
jgi:hypothetical protein